MSKTKTTVTVNSKEIAMFDEGYLPTGEKVYVHEHLKSGGFLVSDIYETDDGEFCEDKKWWTKIVHENEVSLCFGEKITKKVNEITLLDHKVSALKQEERKTKDSIRSLKINHQKTIDDLQHHQKLVNLSAILNSDQAFFVSFGRKYGTYGTVNPHIVDSNNLKDSDYEQFQLMIEVVKDSGVQWKLKHREKWNNPDFSSYKGNEIYAFTTLNEAKEFLQESLNDVCSKCNYINKDTHDYKAEADKYGLTIPESFSKKKQEYDNSELAKTKALKAKEIKAAKKLLEKLESQ